MRLLVRHEGVINYSCLLYFPRNLIKDNLSIMHSQDYPIKEQYTHIFKTIKSSGTVKSASEGFKKVLEAEDATFAFIHDASQVMKANMGKVQRPRELHSSSQSPSRSAMNITTTAISPRSESLLPSSRTPWPSNKEAISKKKSAG